MPIYISQVTLTMEGVQSIKGAADRIEENRKLWEDCGGKLLHWYVVLGDYDYLLITEAPDEKVMTEIAVKASRRGRTKFRTSIAIPIEEFGETAQRL